MRGKIKIFRCVLLPRTVKKVCIELGKFGSSSFCSFFGMFPKTVPIESKNIFIARSWAKREGREKEEEDASHHGSKEGIGNRWMIIKRLILFTFAPSSSPLLLLEEEGREGTGPCQKFLLSGERKRVGSNFVWQEVRVKETIG